MGILTWVLIGVLVGLAISYLVKARGMGLLVYLGVGILGAVVGGLNVAYLYRLPGAMDGLNLTGILVAFAGALVAIAGLRLLMARKTPAA